MYDFSSLYQATDVADALSVLANDPAATVIAGGTDILVDLHHGKRLGCKLISIHGLEELKGITRSAAGDVEIGPLSTFREMTYHPLIRAHLPFLGEAVDQAGGPQLRAAATIGGNVCNGITSADSASTLVALNAILRVQSLRGTREIPISEWYLGAGKTARASDELLVRIIIPKDRYEGWSGHYIKYAQRNAMDIATLGVSCLVKLSADRRFCEDIRLAFGVAAPVPIRSHTAEDGVRGLSLEEAIAKIGQLALSDVNPRSSWRASQEYRLHLVEELSARALRQAILNGGGVPAC